MEILVIKCPSCNKNHNWFTGNVLDQRCYECKNPEFEYEGVKVDPKKETEPNIPPRSVGSLEWQLIEALKQTISTKNDLIANLKTEIDRLKSIQYFPAAPPLVQPNIIGTQPWYNPNPFIQPQTTPGTGPLVPPYIVTSVMTTSTTPSNINNVYTGDPLPNGSIQAGILNPIDAITTYI